MQAYLDILKHVLEYGTPKQPVRRDNNGNIVPVENGTIGTFCEVFRHDMSKGFPLITTKKMAFKTIRVELEGFIKGITSKKWYQERGCKIWNEWANPVSVVSEYTQEEIADIIAVPIGGSKEKSIKAIKNAKLRCDDLGPIYGYQWRRFGEQFKWDNWGIQEWNSLTEDLIAWPDEIDGIQPGYDQLKSIVDQLKANPYDRRMVCSAWNPNQQHMMGLPPCHFAWNIVVYGNKLNLVWNQRSACVFFGIPFNIASYGLLMLLLCEESGLKPGELVGTLHDCHLYNNLIDQAKLQLTRIPLELPKVKITRKKDNSFNIFDWEWKDVILENYQCYDKIEGDITV
jgi:thymidylate synthase